MMDKANRIIRHPLWLKAVSQIEKCEENRIFCRHNIEHFLSVARMASLENIEMNLGIPTEIIYSAALLHDIGRGLQYEEGIPHDEASVQLAEIILKECGFDEKEIKNIIEAIAAHRNPEILEEADLKSLIYRADKMSRSCFACAAEPKCNWAEEKKNKCLIR